MAEETEKKTFRKLLEYEPNESAETVLLLMDKATRPTKNGGCYTDLMVSDFTGETRTTVKCWNTKKEDFRVEPGELFSALVLMKPFNGGASYEIAKYDDPPEGLTVGDFVKCAPIAPERMYDAILSGMRRRVPKEEGAGPDMVDLATAVYEANKARLLVWPAAKSMHHDMLGGLLYHTYCIVADAADIGKRRGADMELLLAGAALHDIGKVLELDSDQFGCGTYSVNGNLFGHPYIGMCLVADEAKKAEYNPEKVRMLLHMIASHHGEQGWGAIQEPRTVEAMLLHKLDDLDATMFKYREAAGKLAPGEQSDPIRGIGGPVYRPDFE